MGRGEGLRGARRGTCSQEIWEQQTLANAQCS